MKFTSLLSGLLAPERFKVRDSINPSAFPFRMGAGSAGTVTRTHPASISAYLNDPTYPLTLFGQAVLANPTENDVRAVLTSDSAITDLFGVSVRPYPFAGTPIASVGAPSNFGGEGPAPSLPVDVLRSGSILVPVSGSPDNVALGGTVYLWTSASAGDHVLGGFEADDGGSDTATLVSGILWGGPPDANGIAELLFHV